MGSVWEGVHATLGTRVAVKLIDVEYAQSGDSRRRFETEARAAAKLQSKHVVEVHDYGLTPEGQPFIVMQYLAGEPLMVVTLVAAQIVVTAMLTSVLATRSSRAALLSRHQLPGLSMRKVL